MPVAIEDPSEILAYNILTPPPTNKTQTLFVVSEAEK